MAPNHYDTIVVGLGAAGVAAASTLAHAGRAVLGLEAQGRVGGRVHTVKLGDGVVELGAEWIHGESPSRVYESAVQHQVPVVFQDLTFTMFRSNGGLPDEEAQAFVNELIGQAFTFMDSAPDHSQPLGNYVTKELLNYIKSTKPTAFDDEDFTDQVLDFVHLLTNNYCATNDWNDLDTKDRYTPVDGHQHISWHTNGYMTFFDIMLDDGPKPVQSRKGKLVSKEEEEVCSCLETVNTHNNGPGLPTLDIKLNTEVARIAWPQTPTDPVVVTTRDGTVYTADNVIVTISVGVLKESYRSLFSPKLPAAKVSAIENIAIGVMDKIILLFDEPWWPATSTFFGFLWRGEDKRRIGREEYWMTRVFGASTPMGSRNALTLWTSGEVAKMVELLPEEEVKEKSVKLLTMFMGAGRPVPPPIALLRSSWNSNPFTRGSYTYDAYSSAAHVTARADLAAPLVDQSGRPRVLFAGEATDDTHFSTVHGAVDTGHREAMRLLPGAKI